jgi:hypothetical protein
MSSLSESDETADSIGTNSCSAVSATTVVSESVDSLPSLYRLDSLRTVCCHSLVTRGTLAGFWDIESFIARCILKEGAGPIERMGGCTAVECLADGCEKILAKPARFYSCSQHSGTWRLWLGTARSSLFPDGACLRSDVPDPFTTPEITH